MKKKRPAIEIDFKSHINRVRAMLTERERKILDDRSELEEEMPAPDPGPIGAAEHRAPDPLKKRRPD